MLKEKFGFLLATTFLVQSIHLHNSHDATVDLPAGTVHLEADNGQLLKVCHSCGKAAYSDSASLAPAQILTTNEETWTLEVVGDQVAFKGSNGNYLARCNNCWELSSDPDAAFVHQPDHQTWSLWTPVIHQNGKYSFKSDNGKFLARCNNCATGGSTSDFAFVHEPNADNAWAQWNVIYTDLPRLDAATFQAQNGGYMRLCAQCGGVYPSAVSVENGITQESKWQLVRIGRKVAIKGSNGNFLSRCNNCWPGGAYPDSAFVHLTTPKQPYSQWTPVRQADGKWTFQADTGKYLAKCNNCAKANTPNLAFVHSTSPKDPWAQWILSYA